MRGRRISATVRTAAFSVAGIAATFLLSYIEPAAAASAEPITVAVGGRLNQFIFVRDDTDDADAPAQHQNPVGLFNYSRLTIEGRARLTSDLTMRGSARFIANSRQADNVDEVWVELAGKFGRLQLGDRRADNAGMIESVAPQAFLHMDDEIVSSAVPPRAEVQMRDGLTFKRFARNATGVIYHTPRWNTLDFSVGYYANGDTPISIARRVPTKNGTESSVSSVGTLSDTVRYRLLAGYHQADVKLSPERISAWNAMFDVFVGPLEVGGTIMKVAPIFGLRERNWVVGSMYTAGPWRFSAGFRQAQREHEIGGALFDTVERLDFQTSYRLGPGINLGGSLFKTFQRDAASHVWRSRGAIMGITVGF